MAQQEVIALKSHKPDPLSTGLAGSKFKDLYWSFVIRTWSQLEVNGLSQYLIIHWVLFSRSPSEGIDALYDYTLETSAMCSSIKSLRVHDLCHVHSLASLQWSGLSDQWMLLPTESCLQCQTWSPWKGRGALSMPIFVKTERNGQASVDQDFSTASQGSCHVHGIQWLIHCMIHGSTSAMS